VLTAGGSSRSAAIGARTRSFTSPRAGPSTPVRVAGRRSSLAPRSR
jgi:hypothetical protein